MRALRALGAIDARWFVFGNNALLLAWGLAFFGLQRSAAQIVTCFATTVGCELLAARLVRGRRGERRRSDLVLSAATAAVSTLVLLVSPEWWFYGLAGAIAILSKYVVRDAASRHVFNPTNFAVVFSVAILSDHLLVRPDQFSGSPWLMVQIVLFGALAITRGARFRTTLGYYAAVLCFALPVGTLLGKKPLWILAPEMNTSTLIFAFLMLTDPRTTPEVPARQWAFGVGVAVVHLCLRYFQVPYSPFIALFVVAGVRSAWARPLTLVAAPRQFPKMQLKWLLVVSVPVFAPACFSSNNAQPGPDAGSTRASRPPTRPFPTPPRPRLHPTRTWRRARCPRPPSTQDRSWSPWSCTPCWGRNRA
jgi:Na+-translocating ferredoxin:NAD+ oxidoreductase RnfD subunit